jgi:hypothetical protein
MKSVYVCNVASCSQEALPLPVMNFAAPDQALESDAEANTCEDALPLPKMHFASPKQGQCTTALVSNAGASDEVLPLPVMHFGVR